MHRFLEFLDHIIHPSILGIIGDYCSNIGRVSIGHGSPTSLNDFNEEIKYYMVKSYNDDIEYRRQTLSHVVDLISNIRYYIGESEYEYKEFINYNDIFRIYGKTKLKISPSHDGRYLIHDPDCDMYSNIFNGHSISISQFMYVDLYVNKERFSERVNDIINENKNFSGAQKDYLYVYNRLFDVVWQITRNVSKFVINMINNVECQTRFTSEDRYTRAFWKRIINHAIHHELSILPQITKFHCGEMLMILIEVINDFKSNFGDDKETIKNVFESLYSLCIKNK